MNLERHLHYRISVLSAEHVEDREFSRTIDLYRGERRYIHLISSFNPDDVWHRGQIRQHICVF